MIKAIRDIGKDEELLYDYGFVFNHLLIYWQIRRTCILL